MGSLNLKIILKNINFDMLINQYIKMYILKYLLSINSEKKNVKNAGTLNNAY